MKSNVISIFEFIKNNKCFAIPVFQRNYGWEEEHCKQLLIDINSIINHKKTHFLGAVVFSKDYSYSEEKLILIDGQQRISSIMLFLKALCFFYSSESERFAIENLIFRNQSKDLRLEPIAADSPIYKKIMKADRADEISISAKEKSSNLYLNFKYFLDWIKAKEGDLSDYIYALKSLTIVTIQLEEENPQEVFESLNSTGKKLSEVDLLRNYILMNLDFKTQQEFYLNYWLPIENNLGKENIEDFFKYFLILKTNNKDVTSNLYFKYKMTYLNNPNKENTENKLNEMKQYSEIYRNLIFDNEPAFDTMNFKIYEILELLDVKTAIPLLLYLLNAQEKLDIPINEIKNILDIFISYFLRKIICRDPVVLADVINILKSLKTINLKKQNNIWEILSNNSLSVPSNELFFNAFKEYDFKKSKFSIYMLRKINFLKSNNDPLFSKIRAEKILPEKLTPTWQTMLILNKDTRYNYIEKFANKAGNYVLVKQNLKDLDFEEKRKEFRNSGYQITSEIFNYEYWTTFSIEERTEQFAEYALKAWPIPKKYNSLSALRSNELNFADSPDLMTNLIPVKLILREKEIDVSSWKDLYQKILEYFQNENSDIFNELLSTKINGEYIISFDKSIFHNPKELKDGIFFDLKSQSAKTIFPTVKQIMSLFAKRDSHYQFLIKDISFVLK